MRRKSDRFPKFIEKKYFDIGTYNRATGDTRKSIRCMKKNNNSIRVSGSPSYIILSTDETISFIGIQLKKKFLKYKKGVPELVG